MAESTGISWCDSTWSPVWGCTEVSPACTNCYARVLANRFGYGWNGEPMREFGERHWNEPLRWDRRAAAAGRTETVFPSMCDPFDKDWPAGIRARFFKLMVSTPNLTWVLLTKRIGNAQRMLDEAALEYTNGLSDWSSAPLRNVWIGSTVVTQEEVDRDVPKLLATPARVRFLSIEPQLEAINLLRLPASPKVWPGRHHLGANVECRRHLDALRGIIGWVGGVDPHEAPDETGLPRLDWVIVGAESGPKARPAHLEWMRSIVQQCRAAGVACHVKQLGHAVLDSGMSSPGEHWPSGMVRTPLARAADEDPPFVVHLKHAKGGDVEEWPEDLRVQQFPGVSRG